MRSPRSSHTWGKEIQYVCDLHIWGTDKDVAKEMETLKTNNEGRTTHIQLLGGECPENISLKGWQHSLPTSLVTSYKRKGLTQIFSSSSTFLRVLTSLLGLPNHKLGVSKQQAISHSSGSYSPRYYQSCFMLRRLSRLGLWITVSSYGLTLVLKFP